ncbi:MAG: hypothetical protein AMXMBFR44_3680 [Candidatus Campbellbacteria bacterium]
MKNALFLLSLAGATFSGYLSGVKLFSKTCAFGETCPIFWGYPACYYGFALFFILLILSSLLLWSDSAARKKVNAIAATSLVGVLFSGYFSYLELPNLLSGAVSYTLGVSTCLLGFIFFIIIFIVSLFARKRI